MQPAALLLVVEMQAEWRFELEMQQLRQQISSTLADQPAAKPLKTPTDQANPGGVADARSGGGGGAAAGSIQAAVDAAHRLAAPAMAAMASLAPLAAAAARDDSDGDLHIRSLLAGYADAALRAFKSAHQLPDLAAELVEVRPRVQ